MAQAGTAVVLGGSLGGLLGALTNAVPGRPGTGIVAVQEDGRFAVALSGMFGVQPPLDDQGFQRFADALGVPLISEVVREATPVGEPARMRYPASDRRHPTEVRGGAPGGRRAPESARPGGGAPPGTLGAGRRTQGDQRRPGRSPRAVALN